MIRKANTSKNILLSGSHGFIGSALKAHLEFLGYRVTPLMRKAGIWDPARGEISLNALEGYDAVIHLAGKNVGCLWTPKHKREIFQSRVRDSWLLTQALCRLKHPPKTVIAASAVGIYGAGFLHEVCTKWESVFERLDETEIRRVHTRFGLVLSEKGGILSKMIRPFRMGLGPILGDGQNWMPWIALEDTVRAIDHILNHEEIKGPLDIVAPETVTQETFAMTLAKHLGKPQFLRIPKGVVRLLGEQADEMLLSSHRLEPKVLLESGFEFEFPTLKSYLP